jgi:RNA polymerase sigma-70 factor
MIPKEPLCPAGDSAMPPDHSRNVAAIDTALASRLYRKAAVPTDWQLTEKRFRQALETSVAHRFRGAAPSPDEVERYLETLRLEDLALACACAEGNEPAWEKFVADFRPELYRAGRAIAGESRGRELADSLYADLYGLEERENKRRSLLRSFYGRSRLTTWLRAVMAQRHVDELRRGKRMEPLEDGAGDPPRGGGAAPEPDPDRARYLALLQAALTEALAGLEPRDRLRLASYYVEELTLAQIGRLLGEHEATVSRKLDRTRLEVRRCLESSLREKKRLSDAQVKLCYEYAREEWPFDLTGVLSARE